MCSNLLRAPIAAKAFLPSFLDENANNANNVPMIFISLNCRRFLKVFNFQSLLCNVPNCFRQQARLTDGGPHAASVRRAYKPVYRYTVKTGNGDQHSSTPGFIHCCCQLMDRLLTNENALFLQIRWFYPIKGVYLVPIIPHKLPPTRHRHPISRTPPAQTPHLGSQRKRYLPSSGSSSSSFKP